MKKLAKIAAILGASALFFGGILTGCYDGAQPGETGLGSAGGSTGAGTSGTTGSADASETPVTGFFWSADDWVIETDSNGSDTAVTKGRVTFDKKIKQTADASAAETPVTVGGKEYKIKNRIQISKGGSAGTYSVSFTVGKNATSIGILAKHSSSGGQDEVVLATEGGAVLKTWTVTNAADYTSYTFDATGKFEANTKVYVYNKGSTGGVNIKAIWAEPVVEETITFTSATKTVENTVANLGIVGTAASSSDEAVATVEITTDGVVVTSKKEGSATITVKDGTKEASFPVTVGKTGEISVGTITKYEAPSLNVTYVTFASTTAEKSYAGTVSESATGKVTAAAMTAKIITATSGVGKDTDLTNISTAEAASITSIKTASDMGSASVAGSDADSLVTTTCMARWDSASLTGKIPDNTLVGSQTIKVTAASAITLGTLSFYAGTSATGTGVKVYVYKNDDGTGAATVTDEKCYTADNSTNKLFVHSVDLSSIPLAANDYVTIRFEEYYTKAKALDNAKANIGLGNVKLTFTE